MLKKLICAVPLLALGACVSVLPDSGRQPPRFRLDPDRAMSVAVTPVDTSLIISDPTAEAVYNTFNVAIATGPYKYEYVDGAEWADRVPVLFRIYLERRFENADIVAAVGDRTEMPVSRSYVLYSDIRAFNIDRTGAGEVARVSFGARLTNPRGHTLASSVFTQEIPTGGRGAEFYADALNEAAAMTTEEAVRWTSGLIEENERREAAQSK